MKKSTQQQHTSTMQSTYRLFKVAPLALAVSLASMAVAPVAQATDLDVYKKNSPNNNQAGTVMMVFDVSRHMRMTDKPSAEKTDTQPQINGTIPAGVNPKTAVPGYVSEFGDDDAIYDFDRDYSLEGSKFYYRRVDKLKMSLYHILDIQKMKGVDSKPISSQLGFGLTVTPNYDYEYTAAGIVKGQEESKGYILVPAYPLDYEYPGTKKPIGVHNRNQIRYANSPVEEPEKVYAGWTQRERLHDAIRYINVDNNLYGRGSFTPLAMAYLEAASYLLGTRTDQPAYGNLYSGMELSAEDVKGKDGNYKSPNQCGGSQGIFILGSGPGFLPPRINKLTTFSPIVQKVIDSNYDFGKEKKTFINCGSDRKWVGYDGMIDTDNRTLKETYYTPPLSLDEQWACPLMFTRSLRGLNYSRNFDFQFDRSSKLFGDDYKEVETLKEKNLKILTGAIGFGKYMNRMASFPKKTRYNYKGEPVQAIDCSAMRYNVDLRPPEGQEKYQSFESFCTFAAETYNYGEGGIYMGTEPGQVSKALNSFISKIPQGPSEVKPRSTGTMTIPFDSLNQLTPRTNAYVPILDPKLDTQELWPGNLKKYVIKNGTLVGTLGDTNQKVFTSRVGFFNANTKDLWNTNTTKDDANPQVGGTYQQILKGVPTPTVNRKTVIDYNGQLKDIKVEAGQPVGFNALDWNSIDQVASDSIKRAEIDAMDSDDKIKAIKKRAQAMKQQLVNFLGYPVTADNTINDGESLSIQQTQNNRVLGGVVHSRPQLVTYDVVLKDDGSVESRKDYLLYGSFDGALHMIDDTNGEELFNFIPHQVLQRQGKAFAPASNNELGDPTKAPYLHGVDAEWAVYGDYKRTAPDKRAGITKYGIKANSMFAFGGLRMGGSMYYGLDITDRNTPKMLYSVGSNYALSVGKGSFTTAGYKNGQVDPNYARMGLTWGKPTVAYVKQGGKKVMVNILPGGYDECYEDPHFQLGDTVTTNTINGCNGKASAQGNAVYIVKVGEEEKEKDSDGNLTGGTTIKTEGVSGKGDALWWASSNATGSVGKKVEEMKHSVVNQVLALDGNYDGLVDHLYYADLGGQVWRADINNDADDFKVERVIRVFDASSETETKGSGAAAVTYSPRIYDTPLVTFQRLGDEGKIHGIVTVGTGDRSNPVDKDFSNNHVYTFIDKDLARYRSELFCTDDKATTTNECESFSFTPLTKDLKPSQLISISYDEDGTPSNAADTQTAIDNGIEGKTDGKAGWKYKLVDSGFAKKIKEKRLAAGDIAGAAEPPKGLKMYNRPDAITGQLYISVFSPEITNKEDETDECSLTIVGATNRERLCLPYGYCFDKNGSAVNRSTTLAGSGIVDNYLGYLGQTKENAAGESEPVKTIGIIDTYCEGDDCNRNEGSEIGSVDNGLNETNVEHGFVPLKWFAR